MKKPIARKQRNIFDVNYTSEEYFSEHLLFVIAPSCSVAEKKAIKFLRASGEKSIKVRSVKWKGEIDVF